MSDIESEEGISMLVCRDSLSDQDENEISDCAPSFLSIMTGGHSIGKELRMQQQDDESSEDEVSNEGENDGVMASVVVDDDDEHVPLDQDATAEPAPKKRKTSSNKARKSRISQDRLQAASDARKMLRDTVPRLPVSVSETHVVRSFGRICVESFDEESKFSSANALYPVGFSCDRYEFSPVHGRVLKMRCTIFDGKKLKEEQRENGVKSDLPDGPLFRIMWGMGVDDDTDLVDYPYDMFSASAPISSDCNVDTVALPFLGKEKSVDIEPEEGMRVRVRHEHDVWYTGTIIAVGDYVEVIKNKTTYEITINYDDGAVEDTYFPDPDIVLYPPSTCEGVFLMSYFCIHISYPSRS